MVHGTGYVVPGTEYMIQGTWYIVHGTNKQLVISVVASSEMYTFLSDLVQAGGGEDKGMKEDKVVFWMVFQLHSPQT